MRQQNTRGFTLAEALIVVAIIGVLVGVSLPSFAEQIEASRRQHDAACVENAITAAKAEYAYDYDGSDSALANRREYVFDAGTGLVINTDAIIGQTASVPAGYGQSTEPVNYSIGLTLVYGTPNDDGGNGPNVVTVFIDENGVQTARWGNAAGIAYSSMYNTASDKSFDLSSISDSQRQIADADGLQKLANSMVGMTKAQLSELLGDNWDGKYNTNYNKGFLDKNGARLLAYYRETQKDGTVKIRTSGTNIEAILTLMGSNAHIISTYVQGGQTRYDIDTNSFFSDYMSTNSGQDRNVKLRITLDNTQSYAQKVEIWVENQDVRVKDEVPTLYNVTAEIS